jgi:hypothetical protein
MAKKSIYKDFTTPTGKKLTAIGYYNEQTGDTKFYLPVAARILWLKGEYSKFDIITELLHDDGNIASFKATVNLKNKEGQIECTGTGHKTEAKNQTITWIDKDKVKQSYEKINPFYNDNAETGAVGRALSFLGFMSESEDLEENLLPQGLDENKEELKGITIPDDNKPTIDNSKQIVEEITRIITDYNLLKDFPKFTTLELLLESIGKQPLEANEKLLGLLREKKIVIDVNKMIVDNGITPEKCKELAEELNLVGGLTKQNYDNKILYQNTIKNYVADKRTFFKNQHTLLLKSITPENLEIIQKEVFTNIITLEDLNNVNLVQFKNYIDKLIDFTEKNPLNK